MTKNLVDVVRKGLHAYADRGVLRGFDESTTRNGKPAFRFVWVGKRPLDFSVDARRAMLRFDRLLPNVPSDSQLYSDVKRFLKSRCSGDLPTHRRIDAKRAEVAWANRRGNVSIAIKVKNDQYAYGLNRLVNLVHEIFVQLNDSHPEYMCENFDLPQE